MNPESLIPAQHKGIAKEVHHHTDTGSKADAAAAFQQAKARLLNVSGWAAVAEGGSARFLLYDADGNALVRPARPGDYVRIDLPGPHRATGSGYDWVVLNPMAEGSDDTGPWIVLTTTPVADPTVPATDIAHFFSGHSTGTFIIRQRGSRVEGSHYGRNELPNTGESGLLDKARALLVTIGAYLGMSDVQWSNLVKGLISVD